MLMEQEDILRSLSVKRHHQVQKGIISSHRVSITEMVWLMKTLDFSILDTEKSSDIRTLYMGTKFALQCDSDTPNNPSLN
jgi:hypothetical protein